MNKKIAIVASYIHPIRQQHLLRWYNSISQEFLNTKLFIGTKNNEIPIATNYKINRKAEKIKFSILNLLKGFKQKNKTQKIYPLANYKPKVIHLLTSNAFKNIEPLLDQTQIKLIVSFRGYDINVFPNESIANKELTQKIFKKAHVLHFVSEDLKQKAVLLKAKPEKCHVINRSISVNKQDKYICPLKNNKKIIILSVGRLVWEKGYIYALETISNLTRKGFQIEYRIVGTGVDYNNLVFHAERLGVSSSVVFIGELLAEQVKKEMLFADIYFQPSLLEGIPNTILEASYYKLPIVSSNIGGIPEVIESGVSGFLSEPCAVHDFVKNIIKLIENKSLRQEFGEKAHQNIIEKFTEEETIKKWKLLYSTLLKE